MPFAIRVLLKDELDINASTGSGSSIRILKGTQALERTSETCQALATAMGRLVYHVN
jgi:hypothetical protein